MARPLRIQFEDACYHVTCRGNAGQGIYASDADRSAFLDLLSRSREIYQVEVLAYALMGNHFHLLIKTPLANLPEFMRHFNLSYTSHFNRAHGRSGHLYQGRYKAFLIDVDSYLQQVSRYIHLSPLRERRRRSLAKRKEFLQRYRWSSYPGYLFPRLRAPFLQAKEALAYFGGDTPQGRRAYRIFVEEGLSGEIEDPLQRGKGHGIVGSPAFLERIRGQFLSDFPRYREVPAVKRLMEQVKPGRIMEAVSDVFRVSRQELLQKGYRGIARGVLMEMLYRHGGLNQREIGKMMGIDYSAVSVARKRFRGLQEKEKSLARRVQKVRSKLIQG